MNKNKPNEQTHKMQLWSLITEPEVEWLMTVVIASLITDNNQTNGEALIKDSIYISSAYKFNFNLIRLEEIEFFWE